MSFKKSLSFGRQGQMLLVVVLTMIVALTVGLSVVSRTITGLRISKQNEESQRAFQAAEAGIEQAIQSGSSGDTSFNFSGNNSKYSTSVLSTLTSGTNFLLNGGEAVTQDTGIDLWFANYPTFANPYSGTVTLYWNPDTKTSCSAGAGNNTAAAIEVDVITGIVIVPATSTPTNSPTPTTTNTPTPTSAVPTPTPGCTIIRPTAAGNFTEWNSLVGAATHWQAVNEASANNDTSYVANSLSSWKRDTFNLADINLPASAQIDSVAATVRARSTTNPSGNNLDVMINGASIAPVGKTTTSYQDFTRTTNTNPSTGASWTPAEVNSLQIGAGSSGAQVTPRMTQAYATVCYSYPAPTNSPTPTLTITPTPVPPFTQNLAVSKQVYDPCTGRTSGAIATGGSGSAGGVNNFNNSVAIPVASGLISKVIPLYNSTIVGITATSGNPLPSQGKIIDSTGTSDETVRKVRYFSSNPQIPAELFPYSIISQ